MGNFKIEFPELKQFIKNLDNASKEDVFAKIDVTNSILKLHNTVKERTSAVFNVPRSLEQALVGHSVKFEKLSNTFGRYGLQYRGKPIPLHEFPHSLTDSNSFSSAPTRMPDGGLTWRRGKWSKEVNVAVRTTKTQMYAKNGQKIFKAKGKLRVRKGEDTWRQFPTRNFEGDRYGMTAPLFGPSIPQMIKGIYDNDYVVQNAKEKCMDEVSNTMLSYYFGKL